MARSVRLAVIAGDGIGPEVVDEGLKVLDAVTPAYDVKVERTEYDLGARRWHATGETLPDSVLDELRGHDAILLGAVGDPGVPSGVLERGLLLRLRFELDHFVNLRPVKLFPGVASPLAGVGPADIDFVVIREGTEGAYAGAGGFLRKGTPHEIATEESVNTAYGVERVVRDAFARAAARPRHKLTLVHKNNVLVHSGDLWTRTVKAVARRLPERRRRLLPRRRCNHLLRHRSAALRRHRHRQPVRRHPHRPGRGDRRWHRTRRQRQHQSGPDDAEHVRARARQRARHCRARPSPTRPRPCCRSRCCSTTSDSPKQPPPSKPRVAADLADRSPDI